MVNVSPYIKRHLNINFHPVFGRVWGYFIGITFENEEGKVYLESQQREIMKLGRDYYLLKETSSKREILPKLKKYPRIFKDEISELEKSIISAD